MPPLEVLSITADALGGQVFVARTPDGHRLEYVARFEPSSDDPTLSVVSLSTLLGCPVRCHTCDAGGHYEGRLACDELLAQVEGALRGRWPNGVPRGHRVQVQFDRMGEPSFNPAVLEALALLPYRLAPGQPLPVVSTVAPRQTERFFDQLLALKQLHYRGGRFGLQVSLHSTDAGVRQALAPVKLMPFDQVSALGRRFVGAEDQKVVLTFAVAAGVPVSPEALRLRFDPKVFEVKLTPVNPTRAAERHGLQSADALALADRLRLAGFEVRLSAPDPLQLAAGAACGQSLTAASRGALVVRRTLRQPRA